MALVWDWEKRRPVGLSGFKNREMLWLWCRLEANNYDLNPKLVGDATSRANHLIDSIEDKETVGTLRGYRDECFSNRLDESEFKWIDYNDKRMIYWLLEMIGERYIVVTFAETIFDQSLLTTREQIELAFDSSEVSISIKKDIMISLRKTWSSFIEIDPSLRWVDKKDDEQCRWLVDEIKGSDLAPWISPDLQSPIDNEDRYLLVINALDRSGVPFNFKTLFLGKIKEKWNRKKNKVDTEKVQCNLSVNELTHKNIRELANDRGLKMGKFIDALVAEEMERLG